MRRPCPPIATTCIPLAILMALAPAACKPSDESSTAAATDNETTTSDSSTPVAAENETTTTGDPWGAMPTTVNAFYFTDFEDWVGKPVSSQEIARLINRPIPPELDEGRAFLMFYRSDCEHCHHMLEQCFVLIAVL